MRYSKNIYRKYLNIDISDFIILRGYKKDLDLKTGKIKLVTQKFKYIELCEGEAPKVDINDDRISRRLGKTLFKGKDEKLLISSELDDEKYNELLEKDLISIGMPLMNLSLKL